MVDQGLVNERYRLDTLLARGGMGEVWQAYDLTLRRTVALKILAVDTTSPTDRERFAREAQSAARLSHPNVVAVYDYGAWNDRPYLVMELLQGQTLSRLLDERGPLPVEQVRDIGAQVCAALQAAHAAGFVHRDIKPSNLILTNEGAVKVVDFGIAGVVDDASTRLTQAGTIVGTAAYLAPERVHGHAAEAASDLYALGCVLYQLLCGSTPFDGGMTAIVYAHIHQAPEPPSAHRPDLPADLEGLLLALLAKDPGQRPTAEAARAALREPATQVIAAPPQTAAYAVHAPPAGRPAETEAPPAPVSAGVAGERRRTQLLIGTAVALVVLAAAGLLWWAVSGDRNSLADPPQNTQPAVQTTEPSAPSATPTPTPTPTPTETPTATPTREQQRPPFGTRAWLEAFDRQLRRLTPGEDIDADVHKRLTELTEKALNAYDEGRPQRARRYTWDLVREVREARDDGAVLVQTGPLRDLIDRIGQQPGGHDNDDSGDGKGDG
ncbi:serine/threonine-protein kinase [Flindersiella endophytica]